MKSEVNGYHPPKQERGKDAVERIECALIDMLLEPRDFSEINNIELAKAAEVHIQSLYQWFEKGKHTVAAVLQERYMNTICLLLSNFYDTNSNNYNPIWQLKSTEEFVQAVEMQLENYYSRNLGVYPILFSGNRYLPDVSATRRRWDVQSEIKYVLYHLKVRSESAIAVASMLTSMLLDLKQQTFLIRSGEVVLDDNISGELTVVLLRYLAPYLDPYFGLGSDTLSYAKTNTRVAK